MSVADGTYTLLLKVLSQVEKGMDSVHKTFLRELNSKIEYSHMVDSYETVLYKASPRSAV